MFIIITFAYTLSSSRQIKNNQTYCHSSCMHLTWRKHTGWYLHKGRTPSSLRLTSIHRTHQWGSLRGCGVVSPLDRAPPSPSTCRCVLVTQSALALLRPQNFLVVTTCLKHMEHHRGGFIVSLLHNVWRWAAAPVSRSEGALCVIDYSFPELDYIVYPATTNWH
jgi:hypothetical protein